MFIPKALPVVRNKQSRQWTCFAARRRFAAMAFQPDGDAGESKWPISKEVPDLSGKVALVTGANSPGGMGFHIAYQLASKNAKVYIGARSASKAHSAIEEMRSQNSRINDGKLLPFVADLGDVRAVRAAAEELRKTESRLDILIHNAAVISRPHDFNDDGISISFTTNHLGPFTLTSNLIPLLKATAENYHDVRVVSVTAASYKLVPIGTRFNSRDSFNIEMQPNALGGADFARYSLSKLANILFSRQLQNNFDAAGIDATCISLHPVLIKTDGVLFSLPRDKQRTLEGRLTPAEGATTALFAATNPTVLAEKEKYKGAYLIPPGQIEELIGNGRDDQLANELWETSERVLEDLWRVERS